MPRDHPTGPTALKIARAVLGETPQTPQGGLPSGDMIPLQLEGDIIAMLTQTPKSQLTISPRAWYAGLSLRLDVEDLCPR